MARVSSALEDAVPAARVTSRPAWLLLVHQLPSRPTGLRVRTWRRLRQLGAVAVKNAVHALPDTHACREDFEWLRAEITAAGGEATVFVAEAIDGAANNALIDAFRRGRERAYRRLANDLEAASRRRRNRRTSARISLTASSLQLFRQRLTAIEQIDFFGSAGRDRVLTRLEELEQLVRGQPARLTRREPGRTARYAGRLWITRPRPGVDRMASAWLIRRFIDPEARFAFAGDATAAASDAVPFDMFGVEFSHRADHCTFEVLCGDFGLVEPALSRIAALVHDLDFKDDRFAAPEAAAIGAVIDGLRLAHADDQTLLMSGASLFEALYLKFAQAARHTGPAAVSRGRGSRGRRERARPAEPRKRRR